MNRLGSLPLPGVHLDLLHPARTLWRHRLRSVALSDLERHVLAMDRGPDIPSETIPGRYFNFLRGGPPEPLVEVFDHNLKDLCGLAALAAHVAELLEKGQDCDCHPADLYGISRLLQIRGETVGAGEACERALARGLPEAAARSARRELALLSRRRRDFERASLHWTELLGESRVGMEAYEQLAIHHEHHMGDLEQAARITREALACLQGAFQEGRIPPQQYRRLYAGFHHRLSRLTRKAQPEG